MFPMPGHSLSSSLGYQEQYQSWWSFYRHVRQTWLSLEKDAPFHPVSEKIDGTTDIFSSFVHTHTNGRIMEEKYQFINIWRKVLKSILKVTWFKTEVMWSAPDGPNVQFLLTGWPINFTRLVGGAEKEKFHQWSEWKNSRACSKNNSPSSSMRNSNPFFLNISMLSMTTDSLTAVNSRERGL